MKSLSRLRTGQQEPHGTCSILLVGGDIGIQAALKVLLQANFRVASAATVVEGFHYLKICAPELVIVDLSCSPVAGTYFFETLRARLPACAVIVLTVAEQSPMLREVAALGIDGFHGKPVQVDKLLEQVQSLFASLGHPFPCLPHCNRYISQAIEYVYDHYSRPFTVQAMANAIGVSSSHLAHLFRSAMGMTVKHYLLEVRLEVAKQLLINTDDTLDSIAERIGFCNASHFSRVFRHQVESWPGAYRRDQQEFSGVIVSG